MSFFGGNDSHSRQFVCFTSAIRSELSESLFSVSFFSVSLNDESFVRE